MRYEIIEVTRFQVIDKQNKMLMTEEKTRKEADKYIQKESKKNEDYDNEFLPKT